MQPSVVRHNVSQVRNDWFFNPLKESENGDEEILTQSQVWTGGVENGRECDAAAQKGNSQIGQRTKSEESQAGNRDRTIGSAEKRSEGSAEKDGKKALSIQTVEYKKEKPMTLD